jgi:hypothetical protein
MHLFLVKSPVLKNPNRHVALRNALTLYFAVFLIEGDE